jgi:hypothetical protein
MIDRMKPTGGDDRSPCYRTRAIVAASDRPSTSWFMLGRGEVMDSDERYRRRLAAIVVAAWVTIIVVAGLLR